MKRIAIVVISLGATCSSLASGIENLLKYTQSEGTLINENSARIIENQAGGFMTGGSIISRAPRPKELSPLHVQLPSFQYDACSGNSDFRFGSLSYISSDEFMRFMKAVPRATGAYAAKLFISTACPQCANIVADLQTRVERVNAWSMNQCSLAQNLVNGIAGKMSSSARLACMIRSNASGANSDLFSAGAKCQENSDQYKSASANTEVKNLIGEEFNLAWQALSGQAVSREDRALAELMMSISGTIVGRRGDDGRVKLERKPSLFNSETQIDNYIGNQAGGEIKIYVCDEGIKCLDVKTVAKKLAPSDTFYSNLRKVIDKIAVKLTSLKSVATDEEKIVIAFSSIPLLNMIDNDLVLKGADGALEATNSEMLDVLAFDLVVGFLNSLLDKTDAAAATLKLVQLDQSIFDDFRADIESTRRRLQDIRMNSFQRATLVTQSKEVIKQQNEVLAARFLRVMASK